jgi:PTS system nitrogen regulatory IIA component
MSLQIGDILDRNAIAIRVKAADKRQALSRVAELAARNFGLDAAAAFEALVEREQAGSTGVGHGVAAPHARIEGVERMRGVFIRLEHPVDFEAIDDQPVDLVFALFAPPQAGAEHLRALARVSRLMRHVELREHLRKARSADAIHALLAQEARPSAA